MSISGTSQICKNGYNIKHNGAVGYLQIGEKVPTPATPPSDLFCKSSECPYPPTPHSILANLLNVLISLGTKEVGGIWHRLAKRVNMCKGRGGAMQLLLGLNLKELPYMTYTNFKVCFFWSLDIKDNLIKV